jgi:hypothetical protein
MAFKGSCSCLEKAADDEPIFVLRGQDRIAPKTVRQWAENAKALGSPPEKVDVALAMEEWQKRTGIAKTPD